MPAILAFALVVLMQSLPSMSQSTPANSCQTKSAEIVATRAKSAINLNAAEPSSEWDRAKAVSFCEDWQGQNASPDRTTTVRVLWTPDMLYIRFECRYREITVFPDSDPDGRRDHLWDKDVAETFLQPDPSRERFYKEFEVSPNGMWIDLNIGTGALVNLRSGLQRSVVTDRQAKTWAAELAIPMKSLTPVFNPTAEWRLNFFRVEGGAEPRFYSAWQPTSTDKPNFHVPKAFGRMRFAEE